MLVLVYYNPLPLFGIKSSDNVNILIQTYLSEHRSIENTFKPDVIAYFRPQTIDSQ